MTGSQLSNLLSDLLSLLRAGLQLAADLLVEWPFVVFVVLLLMMRSREAAARLGGLFGGFRTIKIFGAELELNPEVVRTAREALSSYRQQTQDECDEWARSSDMFRRLERVAAELEKDEDAFPNGLPADYRCTVHVEDLLFSESLYQLVEYCPVRNGSGHRGRRWSIRRGIIGLAWRRDESLKEGDVSAKDLVAEWGMTAREAGALTAVKVRQSVAAVILKDQHGIKVGVIYMDSTAKDAFERTWEKIEAKTRRSCADYGIIKLLSEFDAKLRKRGAVIRIYDS